MILLVMSFLGGSWIPLSALPPGMRALSPFTLNYWGVHGYERVLADGAGLAGIAPHVGVLVVIFLVTAFAGGALLERRIARGLR
jgi:ABC-type multidrug transport system permease subunit